MIGSARFDARRRYRYELSRDWGEGPAACWVMLNPSTADADVDDPTIRRCINTSRALGYGSMLAVNIFALRSTDPKRLYRARDPVGPENDEAIVDAAGRCEVVIGAWGRHGALHDRGARVLELLEGIELRVLSMNKDGSPRHPLYTPRCTELLRMEVCA